MLRITFIIVLFFLVKITLGQHICFDPGNAKVSTFIRREDKLKSQKFILNTKYISSPGIAQPIVFKRAQHLVPDLLVYYFYHKKDSVIDNILYEWDESNFTEGKFVKNSTAIQDWVKFYTKIYNQIRKKYGQSVTDGSLDSSISKKFSDIERKDIWDLKKVEIIMYMTLSNIFERQGNMTVTPTYRIRLYITNKVTHIKSFFE